jgi:hypothetical protein
MGMENETTHNPQPTTSTITSRENNTNENAEQPHLETRNRATKNRLYTLAVEH